LGSGHGSRGDKSTARVADLLPGEAFVSDAVARCEPVRFRRLRRARRNRQRALPFAPGEERAPYLGGIQSEEFAEPIERED
jgi:hypothetical protein